MFADCCSAGLDGPDSRFLSWRRPPVDPIRTDVVVFNDGKGWVETFTSAGTSAPVLGTDRVSIAGDVLTASPPFEPGTPPDGAAVQTVDLHFPPTGYVTTPPRCPRTHTWTSSARFGFADGSVQSAQSASACHVRSHPGSGPDR